MKTDNYPKNWREIATDLKREGHMANCVMCGSRIPDNQGSRTCSMCYGDMDHGKDGYYRQWAEEQERRHQIDEREEKDGN